jgi:hypothetical protein
MGSFHLHIPSRGTLADIFSDFPAGAKAFLKEGFAILAKLSERAIEDVSGIVIESIQSGYGVGEVELVTKTGISKEEAKPLLAVTSLIASMLSSREEGPEDLLRGATDAGILESKHQQAALRFSESVVRNRGLLKQVMELSRLAGGVLPSLTDFETTVDVRLGFEKARVGVSVPLAIVHLDTDAQGQEVWFQLTKKQVQRIIDDMQTTLRRMEEGEKWAERGSQGKE